MLSIRNHRLVGNKLSFRATPNTGGALKARFLVLHYTAGSSAASSVESLCTRKRQGNASAHLVLARGTLLRLIEPGDRWSKVEVEGPSDVEGWVNNRFILRLKDAPRSMLARSSAAPVKKMARKRRTR